MHDPQTIDQMTRLEQESLGTLYGFAKHILGLPVYDRVVEEAVGQCKAEDGTVHYDIFQTDWQKQALESIQSYGSRTSALTSNGAGKTSVIVTAAILGWMALYPRSKVVSTAGANRQIKSQLWPQLKATGARLPGWQFKDSLEILAPNGSIYIGFTTDNEGRAEGWHGNKNPQYNWQAGEDGPLLIIVDEAKTVTPGIFGAFDRCTYQSLLYTSSAGLPLGDFFDSQVKTEGGFNKFRVPASQCPHADHSKNAEMIKKRGRDHALVGSMIFCDWMDDGEETVMSLRAVEDAMLNERQWIRQAERAAFCDFAAGGDENVLALREGNRIRLVDSWRDRDTMAAVGRFITNFRREGLEPGQIWGDDGGLGHPMNDALAEAGWRINRMNFNGTPYDKETYQDRGAEIWYECNEKLKSGALILPDDEELKAQLIGRKKGRTSSKGRMSLESKKDMKRRGLASPDRADAVIGAVMHRGSVSSSHGKDNWAALDPVIRETDELKERLTQAGLAGAFPG